MSGRAVRPALAAAVLVLTAAASRAEVTRIEITSREPVNGDAQGAAGACENVRGRVHGELDPGDRRNRIVQDLGLAPRNARGRVEYVATFSLTKPVDPAKASGVLVYSVVNRGNGDATPSASGHVTLVSGWQGDVTPTATNQTIRVPVARNAGGSPITGPVLARFHDLPAGTRTAAIRIGSLGSGYYPPATLDTAKATLTSSAAEAPDGRKTAMSRVAAGDWAFADCRTAPFPGTSDPTRICLRHGFDPARLYELVYTARDPRVLGIGFAATRDIVSFFRHARADRDGTPNPVAAAVRHAVAVGVSQSGNFIKTFVHLGFNEDLEGRVVWDGVFPYIAGRQLALNLRFAAPGGAAGLYEPGSEPALWWGRAEDRARGRRASSLLDRCRKTRTCPKVMEVFGSAEFWGLRMSPGLVGTDAAADIPLPDEVRRYYLPGTTHGGGAGGFAVAQAKGDRCALAVNPNPMTDTMRALLVALVDWITNGTPPPPSRYPTLAEGTLVAPTPAAMGGLALPGVGPVEPNPLLDYDFGPGFDAEDLTGLMTRQPPIVRRALPMRVPRVDADGNETAGAASALHQAPLGTYLGWNVEAGGFFRGRICGFIGGYVPFARTRAERLAGGDPRASLEERYGTREGYACAVRRAAESLVRERFLLRADADRLIAEAAEADALPAQAEAPAAARSVAEARCR